MKKERLSKIVVICLLVFSMTFVQGFTPFSFSRSSWSSSLSSLFNNSSETTETITTNATKATDTVTVESVQYLPVTMFNYDQTTMNNYTASLESVNSEDAMGLYFGDGNYSSISVSGSNINITTDNLGVVIPDGDYSIRCTTNNYIVSDATYTNDWSTSAFYGSSTTATTWTFTRLDNGNYTIQNSNDRYLSVPGQNRGTLSYSKVEIEITLNNSGYLLFKDVTNNSSYGYLNCLGEISNYFGGWTTGTPFELGVYSGIKTYADHNVWTGNIGYDAEDYKGNATYSGIVNSTLDSNKNIVFTSGIDNGIFDVTDRTHKEVFTNVGLPFQYGSDGYYTFDASEFAAYASVVDNSANVKSEYGVRSNYNLYYDANNTQSHYLMNYGDGSTTLWAPFNEDLFVSSVNDVDYHFGMVATIPFTMTSNGRINPNNDNSEAITFDFSGDDDVWVFIDGKLALDIGGIHNRLNGTINFAENTWELWADNATTTYGNQIKDINGAALSGTLFNTASTTGLFNETLESFSHKESHELTIYYLERGAGSSNCRIRYNLPTKDTVSVTKNATQSITTAGEINDLTESEQAVIDNIDFGFTLYKNGTAVANSNYNLLNANGQVISTPQTDANGHFTLRNGQTARFIDEMTNGDNYYVVEDSVESIGFLTPKYNYAGTCTNGYTVNNTSYSAATSIPTTSALQSTTVTVKADDQSDDSIQFICNNYMNAELPNPSSRPVDDKVVVDYGLGVEIDVLANDVYRGDEYEITEVTGAKYGTATLVDGKIQYNLTQQLTNVEVLTYSLQVTGSTTDTAGTVRTETETKTANVYIIPATSMYYEEDFSNFVTYGTGWSTVGTSQTDNQETDYVGVVTSPYGSDKAYINDSGDSNGASKYADTSSKAVAFKYTFTGTGTTFFARTTNNSGYMRVVIKDASNNTIYTLFEDTSYKTSDDTTTLYNIPVFTYMADNYGTYTVTVTVATNSTVGTSIYGSEFWLDGIRVYEPLDAADANASIATSAYATDGESNASVLTLREKLLADVTTVDENDELVWSVTDQTNGNFVVFTDTNGAILSAQEYQSNGPKEEVYLDNGQSVSFSLSGWDASSNSIYLGVKAPMGTGKVSVNGNEITINNTTDCYYDISDYASISTDANGVKIATFKISGSSDNIISVTNIRVTGNVKFEICDSTTNEDYQE